MPKIRTYHGAIVGEIATEITEEQYADMTARYEDLKRRAEQAAADLENAQDEDLKAARMAYELAYNLRRDDDMTSLQGLIDPCEREARVRSLNAEQRRRDADRRRDAAIASLENLGAALAELQNVPDPSELPKQPTVDVISPDALVGADLSRVRIMPERCHANAVAYIDRLNACLDVIKSGIPADTRKKSVAFIEALIGQTEAVDALYVANLRVIQAEAQRREEEQAHQAKAKEEAAHLPEIVAELRERISELEAKV